MSVTESGQSRKVVRPVSLTSFERADVLRALQERLAVALDLAAPGEVAALVRQMSAVTAELAAIRPPEVSRADEIQAQRNRRRARTKSAGSPSGGVELGG